MNGDVNYDQFLQYSNLISKTGLSHARMPTKECKYRMKRPFSMLADNQEGVSVISKKFKSHSGYDKFDINYSDKKTNMIKPLQKFNEFQDVEMKTIPITKSPVRDNKKVYNEKLMKEMSSYQNQMKRTDYGLFSYDPCCEYYN